MPGRDGFDAHAPLGRTLKGKWRLDELLGEGGTATVYAATHRTGARVAIKRLHPRLCADPDSRSRFRREAYVANAVKHPGVALVMDDDVDDDGTPFLVMELLEGTSLERLRRAKGRLDAELVRSIALAVLDVLEVAHARNIVHRDIKPSNIFLTAGRRIKVLDFGVAAASLTVDGASLHTHDRALLGTPGFMAPEQARSRWEQVGPRSDLWALGATMFTLLSGEPVHLAETPSEQLGLAMTTQARSLGSVAPELPTDLIACVDRALAYEPDARFPDARAMRSALSGVSEPSAAEPVTIVPVTLAEAMAPPAEPRRRRSVPARRGPSLFTRLFAVLAVLTGAGVLSTSVQSRHAAAPSERRSPMTPLASWRPAPASAAMTAEAANNAPASPLSDGSPRSPSTPASPRRLAPARPNPVPTGTAPTSERPVAADPWNQRL